MQLNSRHNHSAVGVSSDDSQLAAVQLTRSRFGVRVERAGVLSMQHDGLLDSREFRQAAGGWLREHGFCGVPGCCNLRQDDVKTVITDFPQTHSRQKLSQMVDYQIRQLCGLTEESYLSDYFVLDDGEGESIPVIIAVSGASKVDSRLQEMQEWGLNIEQLTARGMALCNAFLAIEGASAKRQLLLDVSADVITAVLMEGGRLLQMTALPLGKSSDIASMARMVAAEAPALASGWNRGGASSADATASVESRLETLWITGSFPELGLLSEHLKRLVLADVRIFGVPASSCPRECYCGVETDGVFPDITVAYGLALQALGEGAVKISILPELLTWQERKMRLFPYVVALYVLMVIALIFQVVTFTWNTYRQREQLRRRESELDAISELVPQVEAAYRDLEYQQLRLLPIVELSSRGSQFLKTISSWQRLMQADEVEESGRSDVRWCVYLADNLTFAYNSEAAAAEESGRSRRRDGDSRRGAAAPADSALTAAVPRSVEYPDASSLLGTLGGEVVMSGDKSSGDKVAAEKGASEKPTAAIDRMQPVLPPSQPVRGIQRLSAMYAGGFVVQDEASYLTLKRMQECLNDTELFANVDDYVDFIGPGFLNRYIAPWEHYLVMNREEIGNNYTVFFLKMPLRESAVDYAAEEQE